MLRYTLAAVGLLITAAAADAQPDPNRPYTVVSRIDPWTGIYSNSEFYYNAYTGQPTERGYSRAVAPPAVYPPGVYVAPAYAPIAPATVYYPRSYGWPPPPRVLAGPRYWRR